MPVAAVIATQLTDHAARSYSLLVNGADVLRTAVPIDSIRLVEAGPGSVSTLDFDYEDRSGTVSIPDGTEVWLWDLENNVPLFRGYADVQSSRPAYATGRTISVSCVGVEVWLDWLVLPTDQTPVTPTDLTTFVQLITDGLGSPLRAVSGTTVPTAYSAQDHPMAIFFNDNNPGGWGLGYGDSLGTTISAGTSLREAIRALADDSDYGPGPYSTPPLVRCTVDFYLGLRLWGATWGSDGSLHAPDDYGTLTILDTTAGAIATTALSYELDYGDVAHEVYIVGASDAASGLFGDGTGIRGQRGYIADTAITTAAFARTTAVTFLKNQSASLRGTLRIENVAAADVATVRAGSLLDLTDTAAGAVGTAPIFSIEKTFRQNGNQDWTVAFGGLRPSGVRQTRVLTRAATRWKITR